MKILMRELLAQYFTGDKIEKNEVGGAYRTQGNVRGVYIVLVGKTLRRRPLGRHKR